MKNLLKLFAGASHETIAKEVPALAQTTNLNQNEIKNLVTIEYGTGYPIDAIYAFVRKDYSSTGYDDAMVNPDTAYMERGKQIIKNRLRSVLCQISVRYQDEVRKLETMIHVNEELGLIDTVKRLQTQKDIYARHLSEIETMKNGIGAGNEEMQQMIDSYEMGFRRGVTAKSNELLQSLNNYITPISHE